MTDSHHAPVHPSSNSSPVADRSEEFLRIVQEALTGLQFGQVTIIVHEGTIVQVDRTERKRLTTRQS